jgi:hypothetical protein
MQGTLGRRHACAGLRDAERLGRGYMHLEMAMHGGVTAIASELAKLGGPLTTDANPCVDCPMQTASCICRRAQM